MPVLPPGYGKICVSNQMTRGSILQAWGWRLFPECLTEWSHSICINPPKVSAHRLAFFCILPEKKVRRSCDNISPNMKPLTPFCFGRTMSWHSMKSMWAPIGPKFAIATWALTSPDMMQQRRQSYQAMTTVLGRPSHATDHVPETTLFSRILLPQSKVDLKSLYSPTLTF